MAAAENSRTAWLQGPSVHCEAVPVYSTTPWRLILLGAPGVGKGTQADLLHQRLHACHLSTGDVFRTALKYNECDLSPAMKSAVDSMRRGALVPDATVWDMVREPTVCLRCGFILDGFLRTITQTESLKQLMDKEKLPLTAVLNYELPQIEIVARISGRLTCDKCKAVYHVTERPPKVQGCCDRCDGKLFQREDDKPESVKVRLETYTCSTAPLIEFYKKLKLLISVSATGSAEEICTRTLSALTLWRTRNLQIEAG